VQLGPGELKVFCSLSETGESEESISTEYDGEALDIGFNAQYLLDFLRAIDESQVVLRVKDPQSAGELRPANLSPDQQYRYVVMPMRI
jgi:DNA polymerase-3 subunit beta